MASKVDCICIDLEEINEFFSIAEFERFQKYLDELVNSEEFEEIQVQKPFAGFPEQWYKCKACSHIWRLVHPDFPFKGLWEIVK